MDTCQVAHVESISKVCGISKTTEEDKHQTWTILLCKDADRCQVELSSYKEEDKSKKRRKVLMGKRKR